MPNPVPALEILRRSDGATVRRTLAALGAGLSITDGVPADTERLPARLGSDGTARLGTVADPETAARAVAAVGALVEAGLPAVFVYAFDEIWAIGERVRARVEGALDTGYVLVEDVWAWRIEPGRAGWPPHRGRPERFDRARPELVNTWVALSDAGVDRSCIHYVPLDADPAYPDALATIEVDPAAVRAAPLAAGEGLAWNANVLHWGGPCLPGAPGPRTSCSFSLVRADATARVGIPPVALERLDLAARLSLLARQIAVYGDGQPDVRPEVRAWAAAMCAFDVLRDRKDR